MRGVEVIGVIASIASGIAEDIADAARSIVPAPGAWKKEQRLRPKAVLIADSRVIRSEGLQLKRLAKGKTVLEKREAPGGVLDARGKKQHISERIDSSIRRVVKIGLGKVRRLA